MPVLKSFTSKFEAATSKLASRLRQRVSETSNPNPAIVSPFFAELPAEIRSYIYKLAFGNLTIHLEYVRSEWVQPIPHTLDGVEPDGQGLIWRWRTSTCHRDPRSSFAHDACLTGKHPTDCVAAGTPCASPKAFGWLLSCKQAYVETMPVLYGAEGGNVFHMRRCKLALDGKSVVGVGLAMIVSLELKLAGVSLVRFAKADLGLEEGWPAYRGVMHGLGETCPALKRLALHVEGSGPVGEAEFSQWRGLLEEDGTPTQDKSSLTSRGVLTRDQSEGRALLQPVSDLVLRFGGQLQEVRLVLTEKCFHRVFQNCEGFLVDNWYAWRAVDETGGRWSSRNDTTSGALGYWVESVEMPCVCSPGDHMGSCPNRFTWETGKPPRKP